MPSGDPKHPPPFPFRALTDAEFDELVYLLAHVSTASVAKLRAPDGGLDTVCPVASDPTTASWGIQAKLHREQIKWTNCKESLDRTVANWRAPKVTFAFPRDLTVNQHRLFHEHLSDRHPGVEVDWWGETKLTALLLEGPAARGIAKRFFHSEDPAELADRAIRAGTPLCTAADLLEREDATGQFLRSADPHFDWVSTKRTPTSEPVALAPGTAMRLEFGNEGHELIVDAVPRTPAAVEHFGPTGRVEFAGAPDRDRALELLQRVTAEGGRADLGEALIRFDRIPAPFDELFSQGLTGRVSVRAHREALPWAARIQVDTDEGHASWDVDLVPSEPEPEWDVKLIGRRSGLTLEMRFVWSHSDQTGSLNLRWQFERAGGSAEERAHILAFVIALHGRGTFTIADREERREPLREATVPGAVPDGLRMIHRVYKDLATIQRFAGRTFGPPPDQITAVEAHQLGWIAEALSAGGYEGSIESATLTCGPEALAAFRRAGSEFGTEETLSARFFGRAIPVAVQRTKLAHAGQGSCSPRGAGTAMGGRAGSRAREPRAGANLPSSAQRPSGSSGGIATPTSAVSSGWYRTQRGPESKPSYNGRCRMK